MNKMMSRFFALLVALLLVLPLGAQTVASITGVVSDSTGAVIPSVSVTLSNPQTGVTYHAVTNGVGSYSITNVAPGPGYKLTFEGAGFKKYEVVNVYMNVDSTRTQNAKLQVGGATQTVEVSASAQNVTLNTTDATVGNNFEVQMVNNLPIQIRDTPAQLLTQQPGVTLDGAVTGARTDQNNITLDGLEVNDNATGGFGAITGHAPVDSIQEFRAVTANPLSGAGQGGGGQYELVTKSGTNSFHGNLNEYHRDTNLEANNWFNKNAGLGRGALIRNQFGGNVSGPVFKDKFFFFFDYNGRHDTLNDQVERTVPLDSYLAGNVSYVNDTGSVSTLTSAQVAALDPAGIGFNQSWLSLMNSRYKHANDFSGNYGDLVNTAGYRFNFPTPIKENNYVGRVDYNPTSQQKLFARFTMIRETAYENDNQFPGDPVTYPYKDQSYAIVLGHTWQIGSNKVNQLYVGETVGKFNFDVTYNPQGANQYSFSGLSGPYGGGNNSQHRTYPIPVIRDDFTWTKGRHNLSFGGTFKFETPNEYAAENFNFPSIGVTGNTLLTGLTPSLRPSDIDSGSTSIFDNLYTTALGVIASVSSNFNYNKSGTALKQGSGLALKYRNYETEVYAGDTWKLNPHLTLTYGLRYQNYTVPYEMNGEQSVASYYGSGNGKFTFDNYFKDRVAQSASGTSGYDVIPLIQYTLGGKANNANGYYKSANYNFAPRVAIAYNPSYAPHTVWTAGAGLIYDHSIINALQFQQYQDSYLFAGGATLLNGVQNNQTATLQTAPRFNGITGAVTAPAAPNVSTPFVPYTSFGEGGPQPYGLGYGEFNMMIDPALKTPYSIQYSAGMQHEFAGGFILKMNYVGRIGRRLLAQADASQLVEFPDNASGQLMSAAMAGMTGDLRAAKAAGHGALGSIYSVNAQPWFENQIEAALGEDLYPIMNSNNGTNLQNNTQAVAYLEYPYPQRGDFADAIQGLAANGVLNPNVGMAQQFADNTVWTNKGFSSYNGLLVNLHKNSSFGLEFDLNYTFAHSIDNVSLIANSLAGNNGYGYICDVTHPRACRGNADFDVRHYLNGDFLYTLPFGRGRSIAANVPFWLNEVIGGWSISGLPSFHTGGSYYANSNAYVAGFANNAPATLTGNINLLKTHLSGGSGAALNAYSNSKTALKQFTGPSGFAFGARNNLFGPKYFNLDLGLGKDFPVYKDKVTLKFRTDAFNVLNHPSFDNPSTAGRDITQSSGIAFGTISTMANSPRVLQGSLRLEF